MGIFFILIAVLAWGGGDFLIQRSARKFGDWVALFYISAFAAVILLPFVYKDLPNLIQNKNVFIILFLAGAVITIASIFNFEALKLGKIAVIEPIFAFEIVVTTTAATFFAREFLHPVQFLLIAAILLGVILVSTNSFTSLRHLKWETGIALAIAGTLAMGLVNVLFGIGTRDTNPLLLNWFTSVFVAAVCIFYLTITSQLILVLKFFKNNSRLALSTSLLDNAAWISYSYAMLYLPIAVATGISESYIAIAALLGLKINREQLKLHQILGLIITLTAATSLALVTKNNP